MSFKIFSSSAIMSSEAHDKMLDELSLKIANELSQEITKATQASADELVEKIKNTRVFEERPYLTSYDFGIIADKVSKHLQENIADVLAPVGNGINNGDYFRWDARGLENMPEDGTEKEETVDEKKQNFFERMMDKIKGKRVKPENEKSTEKEQREDVSLDDSDLFEEEISETEEDDIPEDYWDMYTSMIDSGVEKEEKKSKYNGCNVTGYEEGMTPVAQGPVCSSVKLSGKIPTSIGTAFKANGGNVSNLEIGGSDIDLYIDTESALTTLEAESLGRDQYEVIHIDDPNAFFKFEKGDIVRGDAIRNLLIKMALTSSKK